MIVLGISAFYHDSAAAIIRDGEIIAAVQEERFTRKKHDSRFPIHSINFCIKEAGITPVEIDKICFYEKPFVKFDRLLETYLAFAPKGFQSFKKAMPIWLNEKLFQRDLILSELKKIDPALAYDEKLQFSEHHFSHAASAYYPSPFNSAAVLTLDGVGEWTTTSLAVGDGAKLEIQKEIHFPHSLGLLYSAFTYFTGFKVNSGEYKVMGLAPYGEPIFTNLILENLIDLKEDGSFHLNMEYFDYCTGLTMTGKNLEKLFNIETRKPEQRLEQVHMDIAASLQAVTEEAVLRLTRSISKETGKKNLCLAGGVALNCVANGKILNDGYFDEIFIQPAAGDAGGALGAALAAYYLTENIQIIRSPSTSDKMKGSYLGPSYTQQEVEMRLAQCGAIFKTVSDEELIELTARALADQKAVGWRQGRLEYGPRALGGASILADPRSPTMQKNLNLKVKFRESFRPFAPSVIREDVSSWFDIEVDSPYMLLVASVTEEHRKKLSDEQEKLFGIDKLNVPKSDIPAVTHVDYSARVQTVHKDTNPRYYQLITRFKQLTGCSVVVNTSFNVRGEPIVLSPEDSFNCFMGTNLDFLAVGNCVLYKEDQNPDLIVDYKEAFELD